jgi:hypothetical protein
MQRTQRFGNWICFRPQVGAETPTLLCPLERVNVSHWAAVAWYCSVAEPMRIVLNCVKGTQTHHAVLGQECEYHKQADTGKTMKEVYRAVIRH